MNFNSLSTYRLEEKVQDLLDQFADQDQNTGEAGWLNEVYNMFDKGSNKSGVTKQIKKMAGPKPTGVKKILVDWIANPKNLNDQIRVEQYGNSYNKAAKAKLARDVVRQTIRGTNTWRCPKCRQARGINEASIDHIRPVAWHWNTIGYDSDRQTRKVWYTNSKNHQTVCRSCNSAMGSGGINYRVDVGPNHSN